MPTLMTDPRSGGVKKISGVNVLPIVAETWKEVRDETNPSVDWLIASYDRLSQTDVTVSKKGCGGFSGCSSELLEGQPSFGGVRLRNGKFVTFFYASGISVIRKGRAAMHKNGVLNVLEGAIGEIDMRIVTTEEEAMLPLNINVGTRPSKSHPPTPMVKTKTTLELKSPSEENTMFIKNPLDDDRSSTHNVISSPISVAADVSPTNTKFVRYDDIRGVCDPVMLPQGVDPLNRERSLSDSEFTEVFGMGKHTFMALPAWKRLREKQTRLLF